MPLRRAAFVSTLAVSALALSLGGCAHFPKFARATKVKSVTSATLTPMAPFAAEDRLYASAVKAIDQRRYGEALDALQVARSARPGDPRVLTAMAVVYDKLGRFDLSDRYYDQAEKADPGSRIVAMDRSYSRFLRGEGRSASADALAEAGASPAPAARAAIAKAAVAQTSVAKPATANDLYAQAVEAIGRHEYGAALGVLRQARDAAPGDVRVLTALGVTYDHLGRFDLSTRYYALAEKADPGSAIVAQDRETSLALQQHGGVVRPDDVIVLAKAAPAAAAPAKTIRVSRATQSRIGRLSDHG